MATLQHEPIRLGRPRGPAPMVIHILEREQPPFLQGRFDDLEIWPYVLVAHPRAQIYVYLAYLELDVLCLISGNETLDLCKSACQLVTAHHIGKPGESHQDRGEVGRREDPPVDLVLPHDLEATAHPRRRPDGDARHVDGVHVTVDRTRRDLEHIRQLPRGYAFPVKKHHDDADESVNLHRTSALQDFASYIRLLP